MEQLAKKLLDWYNKNGRELPWRVKGKAHPDAYAVWISEIMLQQTTVKTVLDYFDRWMKRFPTLQSLAESSLDDVLLLWQGLGYYTRAKKMYECARVVTSQYNGKFPADREKLLKLPGIGPYTASSICAFAFDLPETVVDGNVIRVLARYYGITTEVDRSVITPLAEKLTPQDNGADYASAIMDLGATVCTPSTPDCSKCPWQEKCLAHQKGIESSIPLLKKTEKKKKNGAVFILTDEKNNIFIRTRPGRGLLSGLWELPWTEDGSFPFETNWQKLPHTVRHIFTHIDLTLEFFASSTPVPEEFRQTGIFVHPEELTAYAFPALIKKVLKAIDIFKETKQ
jgi:A/G-specific adenine glycosylase